MEKLTINNAQKLNHYIHLANYNEYNSNIVTMFMWNHVYEICVEFSKNYALVLVNYHHRMGWLMPFCETQYRKDALKAMKEYSDAHHIPFEIHGMTQEFKDYCDANGIPFVYHDDVDAQDYVYDAAQHATLCGKKMQKRRNHYNAFIQEYQDRYVFKPLDKSDFQNIQYFLQRWIRNHEHQNSLELEIVGIKYLFNHFNELNLSGGCIYVDKRLEAFCITSRLSEDTLQIHVEKANHEIRGLYVALFKHTLMMQDDKIRYVNREDDMGLSTLRKAKHDLHPIQMIRKYTAYYGQTQIIKATAEYLPSIQKLWLDVFLDEDEQSAKFFFEHLFHLEDTTLLVHEHSLIGMVQLREMPLSLNHQKVMTPFIVGMAIHPYYQRCGYMKQLMNAVLKQSQEPFQFIQAYNWDLYRSFGFHEAYTLKKLQIQSVQTKDLMDECCDASHLLDIYDCYVANKNGYRIRDCAYYENFFIPYMRMNGKIYANKTAYICITPTDNGYIISECAYTNLNALKDLLDMFTGTIEILTDNECELEGTCTTINRMFVRGDFTADQPLYINEFL